MQVGQSRVSQNSPSDTTTKATTTSTKFVSERTPPPRRPLPSDSTTRAQRRPVVTRPQVSTTSEAFFDRNDAGSDPFNLFGGGNGGVIDISNFGFRRQNLDSKSNPSSNNKDDFSIRFGVEMSICRNGTVIDWNIDLKVNGDVYDLDLGENWVQANSRCRFIEVDLFLTFL